MFLREGLGGGGGFAQLRPSLPTAVLLFLYVGTRSRLVIRSVMSGVNNQDNRNCVRLTRPTTKRKGQAKRGGRACFEPGRDSFKATSVMATTEATYGPLEALHGSQQA